MHQIGFCHRFCHIFVKNFPLNLSVSPNKVAGTGTMRITVVTWKREIKKERCGLHIILSDATPYRQTRQRRDFLHGPRGHPDELFGRTGLTVMKPRRGEKLLNTVVKLSLHFEWLVTFRRVGWSDRACIDWLLLTILSISRIWCRISKATSVKSRLALRKFAAAIFTCKVLMNLDASYTKCW